LWHSQCTHSAVGVLLGNGDGTFQPVVIYDAGGYQESGLVVADMNGDGKPDIVVASRCTVGNSNDCNNRLLSGTVAVLLGNGDGTFQAPMAFDTGGVWALSVAVADVNGDGKLDVVVANCGSDENCDTEEGVVGVLLGNGDGTLQAVSTYDSGGRVGFAVRVADVNGDSKLDLMVLNLCVSANNCNNGTVAVLLGKGDGTFQAPVTYDSGGSSPGSLAVGDVNGDGKLDVLVGRQCDGSKCPAGTIGVLLGNGDGTFGTSIDFASGGSVPDSLAVADLNGDGKPDLLATNEQSNSVGVLFNTSISVTATALASSLNPSNFGQSVTFAATLTAQPGFYKGKPTGTVDFFDNATATDLGSVSLTSSGTATLQTSTLGPSTHSIVAKYSGDTNFRPSASSALSQVVLGAAAKLSPTSLVFGNQTVGISSSPQIISLTNTGDIPLTFTSITFTGTNPTNFTQTNTCGSSLAGGATCAFSVIFNPTAAGARSAALTLSDDAPSKLQKVPVSGVGVLPTVTFSPRTLTFPLQVIYTTSKAQTVTLTNSGAGILRISNIAASAQFSQTNNCGATVPPAGHCTLTVKFQPTALDTIAGSISATDNAPASPQALPLTAVATAIQLSPVSVSFGNQPVGTKSLAKTVTVSNKSHQTVNIGGIAIHGADPSDFPFISTTCGASLSSGASCFIKVAFMPAVAGKRTARVAVSDDGGGEIQTAALSGNGT
jgi:hypothetical protein